MNKVLEDGSREYTLEEKMLIIFKALIYGHFININGCYYALDENYNLCTIVNAYTDNIKNRIFEINENVTLHRTEPAILFQVLNNSDIESVKGLAEVASTEQIFLIAANITLQKMNKER